MNSALLRLSRSNIQKLNYSARHLLIAKRFSSAKPEDTSGNIDEGPIKYSQSPAYKYKARVTRTGTPVPRLWYEPYVIVTSLAVFLLYFTVLREENDIDQELSRSLYSRIAGLEEYQLQLSLEYNREHGLDTTAIVERLKELKNKET